MRKIYVIACITAFLFLIAGCGQKNAPPPAGQQQEGTQQHNMNMANMEDPTPILSQMNQALDDISSKSQSNKLIDARPAVGNLVTLNNRISPHFTDTGFKEQLNQSIINLNTEINKPSPDKTIVDKQIETTRGLLKQAPGKIMAH